MLQERYSRVLLDSTAELLISQDVEALQSTIHINAYKYVKRQQGESISTFAIVECILQHVLGHKQTCPDVDESIVVKVLHSIKI